MVTNKKKTILIIDTQKLPSLRSHLKIQWEPMQMSFSIQKVNRTVSHTCKSCTTPNKNKKLFRGTPTKTKLHMQLKWKQKRSTICLIYNPCHRLKVTEGWTKKPPQNEPCSNEIDRKTLFRGSILYSVSFILGFKLIMILGTRSEWHCSYLRE